MCSHARRACASPAAHQYLIAQDVTAALDPKKLLVGKEFECDMDKLYDVMGKYLLENLLCLHPADRMPSKV